MLLPGCAATPASTPQLRDDAMVRIAELEIDPAQLDAYLAVLREESATALRVEPGVIAIFPMQEREAPERLRLVEIYASRADYEAHLQTPHFKHYKTVTLPMVKSLRLVEMNVIDRAAMPAIFTKLGAR